MKLLCKLYHRVARVAIIQSRNHGKVRKPILLNCLKQKLSFIADRLAHQGLVNYQITRYGRRPSGIKRGVCDGHTDLQPFNYRLDKLSILPITLGWICKRFTTLKMIQNMMFHPIKIKVAM